MAQSGKAEAAKSDDQAKRLEKVREGVVLSNKMDKTVVVAIVRQVMHKQYGKFIRRTKKYVAHDENNACNVGDTVQIVETRPMSRTKRWLVNQIVTKAV